MKVGLAVRYETFRPALITRLARKIDDWGIPSVWFNDSQIPIDTMDVCGMVLGATRKANVATGILRIHEYDVHHISARAHTLNVFSGGRFILGVGTGKLSGRAAIDQLAGLSREVMTSYADEEPRTAVFFSALRSNMTRIAFLHADGVLLNFCTPIRVANLIPRDIERRRDFRIGAYVKLFFSEDEKQAMKRLVGEFVRYNSFPNYHALFEAIGVAKRIEAMAGADYEKQSLPDELLELALCNPSRREVKRMMGRLARSGVDMPIVSLYAEGEDEYKLQVVKSLASVTF